MPEQVEALEAIDQVEAFVGQADLSINAISAAPKRGADLLSMARAAQPGGGAYREPAETQHG